MSNRPFCANAVLAAAALLGGCATLNSVTSDVSSYGNWPSERKPGTYAFERLPSQQSRPDNQAVLEDAARLALQKAGFSPAADRAAADVTVQLGARLSRTERGIWDDPFWGWGWGPGYYWRRPWPGFGWGPHYSYSPTYEREVAILIRDRAAGTPLYEARATTSGTTAGGAEVIAAMYEAALKDFPVTPAVSPRRVSVPLGL